MNSTSENSSPSFWANEPYIIAATRRASSRQTRRVRSIMDCCWSIVLRTVRRYFRAAILALRSVGLSGTRAPFGPDAVLDLVAVLVARGAFEMVRILLETDPLEAQGLDKGYGGSIARI